MPEVGSLAETVVPNPGGASFAPDRKAGGRQLTPQAAPGIKQVLVNRVAVGAELERDHVDRHVVEGDGDEHLALAVGQLRDCPRQHLQLKLLLKLLLRAGRSMVGQQISIGLVEVGWMSPPGVSGDLGRDLEDDEPVGPRGETAEPAEVIEPTEHVDERVIGGLVGEIIELRTADRTQLGTPTGKLMDRDPPQQLVQTDHGLVVAGVSGA